MKKVLKWIGIVLGVFVGLIIVVFAAIYIFGGMKLGKKYQPEVKTFTVPTDPATIARGEHIVNAIAPCADCHGQNLGGQILIDEPMMATIAAANLTSGEGGAAKEFSDEDWIRALRYGVSPEGDGLFIMPVQVTTNLSDEDLAAVIAYLRSVTPVNNILPRKRFGPMGRLLVALGQMPPLPADSIDPNKSWSAAVQPEVSAGYGEYLVNIGGCRDCHSENLAGIPPTGEGSNNQGPPPGPNLTSGGELVGWDEAAFMNALRTGLKPSGSILSEDMPWKVYGKMTDDEIKAIWAYLQSLPALPANQAE